MKKMQDLFINSNYTINGTTTEISSQYLAADKTKEQLEKEEKITIYKPLTDKEIKYLRFRKKDGVNEFNFKPSLGDYNLEYAQKIIDNIIKINDLYPGMQIKILIDKRKELKPFLDKLSNCSNLNISIKLESENYSLNEYLDEDKKLDNLIVNIKNSSMSSFEKYMAVYNIVKKFKEYKENEEDKMAARKIRYIIDNEYIVCAGYANLMVELLSRIGINAEEYGTDVYSTQEQKDNPNHYEFEHQGSHARVLVNLIDPKYNIDGYYISDPTWDNNRMEKDLWNHALQPIDSMQVSYSTFLLKHIDYFLDVHSIEEYQERMESMFDTTFRKVEETDKKSFKYKSKEKQEKEIEKLKTLKGKDEKYSNLRLETFENMLLLIKETLKNLDYDKYKEIFGKKLVTEEDYINAINKLGYYFVEKNNKRIPNETIMEAASKAKLYETNEPDAFRLAYKDAMLKVLEARESEQFPLLKNQFLSSSGYQTVQTEEEVKTK